MQGNVERVGPHCGKFTSRVRLFPRESFRPGSVLSKPCLASPSRDVTRVLPVALMLLLALSGCGYRVASQNRVGLDLGSVAVVPLENATTTYEVEQFLTRSLIEAFVKRTGWKVVESPDRADAVLTGIVSSVGASPVTFGAASFGSTFLVTVTAAVEFRDRRNNKVLFRNDRYIFREQYVINSDVENFFSEQSPALQRVAEDFASSVVASILEGF